MSSPVRLGVLTPSSNTALEPLTSAIVAGLPGVSAHFARFKVTEISLSPDALGQFDDSKILAAAELLADAKVDVIGWSGTAAGWMGFERDQRLVERIHAHTGIKATTAVLALNELLALKDIRRLGLVTPYTADVQQRIVANYATLGVEVVAERHLDICVNHDFALVPEAQLLVLDEPMSALDEPGVQVFEQLLRDWRQAGTTVLWIEHDLQAVGRLADRVTGLNRRVLFDDTPQQVLTPDRLLELFSSHPRQQEASS